MLLLVMSSLLDATVHGLLQHINGSTAVVLQSREDALAQDGWLLSAILTFIGVVLSLLLVLVLLWWWWWWWWLL